MNIIKLKCDFNKKVLEKFKKELMYDIETVFIIDKKIEIDDSQCLTLKLESKMSNSHNIRVIIGLKNMKTKDEEIVKEFYYVFNYYSLSHICFNYKDNIFVINTNIKIDKYSFTYRECIEEITNPKDTYMYIQFVLLDNNVNIDLLGCFICSNIQFITKFVADFILQKLDYLGFDEIYSDTDYETIEFAGLEIDKTKKDMMSFLIYCLRCISHSLNNIYTYDKISRIAKTIVSPF